MQLNCSGAIICFCNPWPECATHRGTALKVIIRSKIQDSVTLFLVLFLYN